jgi:hypothetical protein
MPVTRLACNQCGAHVRLPAELHIVGGRCGVCDSYALVPVDAATVPQDPWLPLAASERGRLATTSHV